MTLSPERIQALIQSLETDGEKLVRRKKATYAYSADKLPFVDEWLADQEKQREDAILVEQIKLNENTLKINKSIKNATWVMAAATVVITIITAYSAFKPTKPDVIIPPSVEKTSIN